MRVAGGSFIRVPRKVSLWRVQVWGLSEAEEEGARWGVQTLRARNGLVSLPAARQPLWLDGDRRGVGWGAEQGESWKR